MATRAATIAKLETYGDDVRIVTWEGLLQSSDDVGAAFEMPGWADRSVQLDGTLGTGGELTLQGSNHPEPSADTHWGDLTDAKGDPLVLDNIGELRSITELPRWIRPVVTAGDGDTDLTVRLLARRPS